MTTRFRLGPMTLVVLTAIACGPPLGVLGPADDETDAQADMSTSTSTSTSTTTSTSTSTTTSGPSFVPEDDMIAECDHYAQDCPEGEKCVPFSSGGDVWDDQKCVPILGEQATGEPCTYDGMVEATDDCDGTGMCWDVWDIDGELIGTCSAFCTGSPDAPECPLGSSCTISGSGVINVCISGCDPTIQDCHPGLGCYFTGGQFNCIFTDQDIPAGQPCEFINDCALGLGCVAAELLPACEGSACCAPFCELDFGDAQCDAVLPGTACVAFYEEDSAPPGYEHVGMCLLPEP